MSMNRFFKFDIKPDEDEITINGDDAFHISSVLRLKSGEKIAVCDGKSHDYICEIKSVSKNEVLARVIEKTKSFSEPGIEIVLFQGLPKSDKIDFIIQKCVELGVTKIVPVITEFTISRPYVNKENKIKRFRKISEAAAKQSGRGIVPEISDIIELRESIPLIKELSSCFVAYENEKNNTIKSFLKEFKGASLGFFIGPEGGFSIKEIEFLTGNGVQSVSLGKRILRTETAGLAAIAMINYELECF